MFNLINNEKGVTLVELLASIVILSIILLSFLTFFTNSFQYNAISSDKMKATNIAREVQEEFKVNPEKNQELKNLILFSRSSTETTIPKSSYPKLDLTNDIKKNSGILKLFLTKQNFIVEVEVDTNIDPKVDISLSKIHVQVKKGTKLVSETYTYLKN
ncbi:prepilin-type N-terminal cleavage/methylation domain-containing protein [Neobacillus sp. BF23-41]|uniref:type IV pilus modification PilV family protein n=1 Tax=Neobacillus sp. BF23-41 TaxID=3240280 RepID=UPI0034E53E17